ncbi:MULTISPECIES: LysR family transcriptional regulator [Bartonella]|uniref:LysR family transcriptional regulator n=1 Tax=Bartonella TaxID=773 RepID=UPI0018DD620D|nr:MULTISPECIES: LysR family transcriptional regulator [Bartonella]MBH9976216.1 LysR family transcriptional regulator [Bartonella choladocola]MBI0015920.1 LysR family transcriptional regulator [Bartonella sp. B10834G3]MBI0141450.1 LysR family transcriptional regulator [Bartonella choladocola]
MGLLTKIRGFIEVVEAGGFSAAARKTHKSKALLSKHVHELEDELGAVLLNRTTRQLSLTEAGHAYYLRALEIIKELDDLNDTITRSNKTTHGRIKIGTSRTFADAPIGQSLIDFLSTYKDIHLDISLDDRFVDMVNEGFDLAIRITDMQDSSLIQRKLMDIHSVIVASPELLKATNVPKLPRDLKTLPCLVDRNSLNSDHWVFKDKEGSTFSVAVSGRMAVNGPVIIKRAAIAGIGFAKIPRFIAEDELRDGLIKTVLDDFIPDGAGLYVVYPQKRYLPAKVRMFIDYLVQWFKTYEQKL